MDKALAKKMDEIISAGLQITQDWDISRWSRRAKEFLRHTFGPDIADEFGRIGFNNFDQLGASIGYIEGLSAKVGVKDPTEDGAQSRTSHQYDNDGSESIPSKSEKKVFVVHGHDSAAKESVARFIEKVGLMPIILHEQPNIGRTIIEKFEIFSDVNFAVVLFTPDDEGYPAGSEANRRMRARQNVVLELGYFIGKLGRKRVCALFVEDVEMPSDYRGVLYIKIDTEGGWKTKLAQELVEAGIKINLEGLL